MITKELFGKLKDGREVFLYTLKNLQGASIKIMTLGIDEIMVGDWLYITDHPMKKEAKQVKPEHLIRSLVTFEPIPLTDLQQKYQKRMDSN